MSSPALRFAALALPAAIAALPLPAWAAAPWSPGAAAMAPGQPEDPMTRRPWKRPVRKASAPARPEAGAGRSLRLPPPELGAMPLARALAARRSVREFGRRALSDAEVGSVLWAGQGLTSAEGGRAAPSAGALYPVTLMLADARGTWRYLPAAHALERVAAEDRRARLAGAALGQAWIAGAPAIIAVTARPAVLEGRYGARAERYCMLEAGHVAQNVLLAATALGLVATPVGAFDDGEVRGALAIGPDHLALYLLPIGAPRRGGE